MESRLAVIRQRTHTGRPLGTAEFIQRLEKATERRLTLQSEDPTKKSLRIEDKVNSRSILSNSCFPKVPVPSDHKIFKILDQKILRMLRGDCAKAEGFRDSAERPVDGPDLRAVRGDARGNELSID